MFVSGKPLSNPQNLTCWQVISIPDGLTKAVAWRQLDAYESAHRVAGRHIILQSKSLGLAVFDMGTLRERYTIDLCQVMRQTSGSELKTPAWSWQLQECKTRMAIQAESTTGWWVLVFSVMTGQLQASYGLPASHRPTCGGLTWVGTESWPILTFGQHMGLPRSYALPEARNRRRSDLTVKALHVWSSETFELAHAHRDIDQGLAWLVRPAPGGCLVLTFQWNEGQMPRLLVRDIQTGTILHERALSNTDDPFRKQSRPALARYLCSTHL